MNPQELEGAATLERNDAYTYAQSLADYIRKFDKVQLKYASLYDGCLIVLVNQLL